MIRAEHITAGYGPCDVLQNISASAEGGEFIALLGPNGSGKSTLIKVLSGLIEPRQGQVVIGEHNIHDISPRLLARQRAYMDQSREAVGAMTGQDILELGRAPFRGRLGTISAQGREAISRAAQRTQIEPLLSRRFDSLSGGEKARVLLGRALAVDAPVLFADEPIAALDPYYQISMMKMLKAEAQSGKTVVAALHDLSLAHDYADRVWIMHNGKLVVDGTAEQAFRPSVLSDVFGIEKPIGGFQSLQMSPPSS